MVFQNDILAGASGTAAGYTIGQSIRFNDDDSSYLTKTFGADGGDTWTLSLWLKRGNISTAGNQYFFSEAGGSGIGFVATSDKLRFYNASSVVDSTQVFRDVGGWYHFVFSSNAGTVTITVNNTSVEIGATTATLFNRNNAWSIGRYYDNTNHFDGYLAEISWIDGQALAPTDFGETNDDGVWIPKAYSGSYGTNGFYLKGQNSAALGDDSSGNTNDFTSSGLTSDDQRSDTPTNNLMTFNPLNNMRDDGDPTDGNRVFKNTGSTRNLCGTTFHFNTGKYVQAFSASGITSNTWQIGTMPSDEADVNDAPGANEDLNAGVRITPITNYYIGGTGGTTNTGIAADANDTYWVAVDLDAGKQWVGIYDNSDGTMKWFDSSAGTTGDPAAGSNPTSTVTANDSFNFAVCGRSSVELTLLEESEATAGTIPSGFTYVGSVKDTYAAPTITDGSAYFQTTLYTGTGSTLEVNQSENSVFQPDLVWIKQRNKVDNHVLTDAVRGAPAALYSNSTAAEVVGTGGVTSLDADGFTLGTWNNVNQSGIAAAAWQWLAANGTASNIDGSITSTVSANTTAGFSIIGYTGNATSGATIGHGLSQAPEVVITKSRDNGTGRNWAVFHTDLGPTKYLELDNNNLANTSSTRWNDTAPSSTVVTLGSQQTTNDSGAAMIAYCWYSVEGFSKFGSYTGNGSTDGPFNWCGFRPAWVMLKRTDSADNWVLIDAGRNPYNVANLRLYPDTTNADTTSTTHDLLSNGFKLRASDGGVNGSGGTYIFMAFAENPFGGNGVAPVPAR